LAPHYFPVTWIKERTSTLEISLMQPLAYRDTHPIESGVGRLPNDTELEPPSVVRLQRYVVGITILDESRTRSDLRLLLTPRFEKTAAWRRRNPTHYRKIMAVGHRKLSEANSELVGGETKKMQAHVLSLLSRQNEPCTEDDEHDQTQDDPSAPPREVTFHAIT